MWEIIKKALEGNPDALKALGELETTQGTLTDRVTYLEKESKDAFTKRDTAIGSFEEAKKLLGLSEITEETIKGLKKGDDSAEIQNLKDLLQTMTISKEAAESDFASFKTSSAMDKAITAVGIGAQAANPKTLDIITSMLHDGATILEDGSIGYKTAEATTVYGADGKPLTLEGKVSQISSDEAYFGLFKPQTPSGGGSTPNDQGGSGPSGKADFGGDKAARTSAVQSMLDKG